ncbi:30S ribosomal protein S16 [Candidatus Uhrbacteria bacterium]|nr:30S ribosomal protein S16 [Candidatus Uhrbacteria bacterium]
MLMIRLARRGKKNKPVYRVVVSEKARDLFGDALEIVGTYDPLSAAKTTTLDKDRILYWISKGAHASPTVYNLLVASNIVGGKPIIKKRIKAKEAPQKEGAQSEKATA